MTASTFIDGGPFAARRSRRRVFAASAVCAGHVLLLLMAWELRQAQPRDAAEARRQLTIRLLPDRRAARAPAAAAPVAARVTTAQRPVVPLTEPAEPTSVSSVLVAVPAAAAASSVGVADTAGQGGAAAAAPGGGTAALSLKPSREVLLGSMGSNEAVHDPRSNTPKPTFEERIAMGLNPELCVKVERLPDGTIKRSMGKWRGVLTTSQATGLANGAGTGGGVVSSGGLTLGGGGGGGGIKFCT